MKHKIMLLVLLSFLFFPREVKADFVANHLLAASEISRDDLVQIFFFFKKFESNQAVKVTVILPPPNSYLFWVLATKELGISPSQYITSIRARMIDGSASPIFADTESEVLIKVANIPYSIGYYYNSLKVNDGYGVKTIAVK